MPDRHGRQTSGRLLLGALAVVLFACVDKTASDDGADSSAGASALSPFAESVLDELDLEAADPFTDVVTISDASGGLRAEVPAEWSQVDGRRGPFGPDLRASTSLTDYNSTYHVAGFQMTATEESTTSDPGAVLDELAQRTRRGCEAGSREPYEGREHRGVAQVFSGCGGGEGGFVWVALVPDSDAYVVVLGAQVLTTADVRAFDHVLDSYEIDLVGA